MIYSKISQKLTQSKQFQTWQKEHSDNYLTHFYAAVNNKFKFVSPWELGYYSKTTDKITTFIITDQEITQKPEEAVFKKEEIVEPLELEKVKIDHQQAFQKFQEHQKKEHPHEQLLNGFVILQNFKNNIVWNISFATKSMQILNFKLDAITNNVLFCKLINFIENK